MLGVYSTVPVLDCYFDSWSSISVFSAALSRSENINYVGCLFYAILQIYCRHELEMLLKYQCNWSCIFSFPCREKNLV